MQLVQHISGMVFTQTGALKLTAHAGGGSKAEEASQGSHVAGLQSQQDACTVSLSCAAQRQPHLLLQLANQAQVVLHS